MGKLLETVVMIAATVAIQFIPGVNAAFDIWAFAYETAALTALAIVSQSLMPHPSSSFPSFGAPSRSAVPTRKYIYGHTKIAGDLIFAQGYGNDNEYLSMLWAVAGRQVTAFETLFLENDTITLSGSAATGTYAGNLSFWSYLGTSSQAADSTLHTAVPSEWTVNHTLTGIAYYHIQYKFDQSKWASGARQSYVLVKGHALYDPRLDSTVAGGSGTQRAATPSTWAYSNNPALVWLDYIKDSYIGPGIPITSINLPAVITAANICDELVTNKDATTSARYTCDGVIDSANTCADNIKYILGCMGGASIWQQGQFFIYAAGWLTPTITLNENDLTGDIQITTKVTRKSRFNAIRGLFLDNTQNYSPIDFPPKTNSTYETQDGERIWKDFSFPMTFDNRRAQRLAQLTLKVSRDEMMVKWPCNLKGLLLRANDTVMITHARMGWSSKTFRILEWEMTPGGVVNLTLKSDQSSNYSWTASSDELTQSTPGTLTTYDPATVLTPAGFALAATSTTGASGVTIPALTVSWTATSSPYVGHMDLQYKQNADTIWASVRGVDPADGSMLIPNLMPTVSYNVKARYVTTTGVTSAWVSATLTTSSSMVAGSASAVAWTGVSGAAKPADNATLGDNLIKNPVLAGGDGSHWNIASPDSIVNVAVGAPTAYAVQCPAGSIRDIVPNDVSLIPVGSNKTFFRSSWVYADTTTTNTGGLVLTFYWYDAAQTVISSAALSLTVSAINTWQKFTQVTTVPDNAAYVHIRYSVPSFTGLGKIWLAALRLSNSDDGATVGAPSGTNVGSTAATDIETRVTSGLTAGTGVVATDKVITGSIVNTSVNNAVLTTNANLTTASGISYADIVALTGTTISGITGSKVNLRLDATVQVVNGYTFAAYLKRRVTGVTSLSWVSSGYQVQAPTASTTYFYVVGDVSNVFAAGDSIRVNGTGGATVTIKSVQFPTWSAAWPPTLDYTKTTINITTTQSFATTPSANTIDQVGGSPGGLAGDGYAKIQTWPNVFANTNFSGTAYQTLSLLFDDAPGAGTFDYKVVFGSNLNSAGGVSNIRLALWETKK